MTRLDATRAGSAPDGQFARAQPLARQRAHATRAGHPSYRAVVQNPSAEIEIRADSRRALEEGIRAARVALVLTWGNTIRPNLNVVVLADGTLEVGVAAEDARSQVVRASSWNQAADLIVDYCGIVS
jgi:hypothetical protein